MRNFFAFARRVFTPGWLTRAFALVGFLFVLGSCGGWVLRGIDAAAQKYVRQSVYIDPTVTPAREVDVHIDPTITPDREVDVYIDPTAAPTAAPAVGVETVPTKAPIRSESTAAPAVEATVVPAQPPVRDWFWNSGASGSIVLPVDAICHGDLVSVAGKNYGDGPGGAAPVVLTTRLAAGSEVRMEWGSCSSESFEQIWTRLAARPEGFVKVP